MLQSLQLRHFQIHRKLTITFDPQITTLVGSTDAGKSSVVRALILLCLNQPSGLSYLRMGADSLTIRLDLDGCRIIRKRSKSQNIYKLDGKKLKSFGTGVPEPIAGILNVTDTNFQEQLEPHFWLTESPGQVAKNLNKIINLDIIDSSSADIAARLRKAKVEVEVIKDRLTNAKSRLKSLRWVPKARADLQLIGEREERHTQAEHKALRLSNLLNRGKSLSANKSRLHILSKQGETAILHGDRGRSLGERADELETLLAQINRLSEQAGANPDLTELLEIRKRADQTAESTRNLDQLLRSFAEQKKELKRIGKDLTRYQEELETTTKGRCPLCGQKANPSQLSAPTFTCATDHPLRERVSRIGTQRKKDT